MLTLSNKEEILSSLGLSERQTDIYLALIEGGLLLPQHLALACGIKRPTLYLLLPQMIEDGLISEVTQGKRRYYQATPPEHLLEKYEERHRLIKDGIGDLISAYRLQGLKPSIQAFDGLDGIQKMYLDTLRYKGELLTFTQVNKIDPTLLKWVMETYVPQRVRHNLKLRAIAPTLTVNTNSETLQSGKQWLRETRFVPSEIFPFRIEGMIYADKVAFQTREKGGPLAGVIIQSKPIADSLRALFELAWRGAESFNS